MMEMQDEIAPSKDVVARHVSGETVLLHLETGTYFGLNAVGARLWDLITQRPRTLAALSETIESEFEVSAEIAARDILALAEELERNGLLA